MIELRDFLQEDVDHLVKFLNDTCVTQFLSTKIPSPYTKEDATWWVQEGSKALTAQAITKNGQLLGCISVHPGQFEYQRSGEIGYWLAKEYWRQGIASAAIKQIVSQVFSETELVRIFASVFSDNQASVELLLKTGFQQEAILRKAMYKNGNYYDCHMFSVIK